jgi:hypothetical protein
MSVEERVRAALTAERVAAEQSLADAAHELAKRRDALRRVRTRLQLEPEGVDVAEVANAALAFEAIVGRIRFLQDHLRRLSSRAEYEYRVERVTRASAAGHGATPGGSNAHRANGRAVGRRSAPALTERLATAAPSDERSGRPRGTSSGGPPSRRGEDDITLDQPATAAMHGQEVPAEGPLRVADHRLEERRDSLRGAAWVVKLCPDAGDPVDLAELAAAFERSVERASLLRDHTRGPSTRRADGRRTSALAGGRAGPFPLSDRRGAP